VTLTFDPAADFGDVCVETINAWIFSISETVKSYAGKETVIDIAFHLIVEGLARRKITLNLGEGESRLGRRMGKGFFILKRRSCFWGG